MNMKIFTSIGLLALASAPAHTQSSPMEKPMPCEMMHDGKKMQGMMVKDADGKMHCKMMDQSKMDHSKMDQSKMDHSKMAMHHEMAVNGATQALESYRAALVDLDAQAMTALFSEDSHVFENGKYEGSFADYLAHHIGPELDAIESFTFTDPTLDVDVMGHVALGRETYRYDIVLKDGRTFARQGVATSVLHHDSEGWKIVSYHSSSRTPRD